MKRADGGTDVMIAVTFAEVGEWETARRYAPPPARARVWPWIERHLVAASLAEESLHEDARRVLGALGPDPTRAGEDALDAFLRSRGIRMCSGVLSPEALGARP